MTDFPPLPTSPTAPEHATIMVVDDEREILIALEDLFDSEYRVLAFQSPVEALAAIDAHPDIAVIISDQRMPEMPGNRFLAEARRKCQAEALLLTGYADLSAVVSAVNEGGIGGYAQKPWEEEALRATVASAAERYRLRRALAFEQAIFAGLSERSPDRISVVDAQGRTVRSNRAGTAAEAADMAALNEGRSEGEEKRIGTDGAVRWIRTQRIPFTADGSAPHLLKIESDETERRLTEQKLHQSEKLQALGTLAGGIAHDFNNLLAAIIGNLELAERRAGTDERLARFLRNAADAAQRGTALSQRLLSFSRQRDLAAESFDPNEAVASIEDLISRSMAGVVTTRFDLADGVWPVRVDRGQFELALLNLCINARDAMPRGGEIVVATRNAQAGEVPAELTGEHVAIAVTDTGTGMSSEVLARVFEPFFTTKELGQGTGLGLPMVHAMAGAAGGTITIDTRIGEGTTVTVWLPRVSGEAGGDGEDAAPGGLARSIRVLLVEDDADVRAVAAAYLAELGHECAEAENGDAALALMEADGAFDLVITDYAMPGLSGFDLCAEVAARRPGLPVLLVTGFADVATPPPGVTVLTKPFTRDALAIAMARAVSGNEPNR